eukprot:2436872-Amphidinium_carterae.1
MSCREHTHNVAKVFLHICDVFSLGSCGGTAKRMTALSDHRPTDPLEAAEMPVLECMAIATLSCVVAGEANHECGRLHLTPE